MILSLAHVDPQHGIAVLTIHQKSVQIGDRGIFDALMHPAALYSRLVLDLGAVVRIDSLGIGAIMQAKKACEGRGGDLVLTGAQDHVAKLIRYTASKFAQYETVDAAVAALRV